MPSMRFIRIEPVRRGRPGLSDGLVQLRFFNRDTPPFLLFSTHRSPSENHAAKLVELFGESKRGLSLYERRQEE